MSSTDTIWLISSLPDSIVLREIVSYVSSNPRRTAVVRISKLTKGSDRILIRQKTRGCLSFTQYPIDNQEFAIYLKRLPDDQRTIEQIYEHYTIEKELATRLKSARREERYVLYSTLYDKLFQQLPHHPQIRQLADTDQRSKFTFNQLELLRDLLAPQYSFLEVGAGDCSLSLEVAKYVKKVYAIDVSDELTKNIIPPRNFELIISDGVHLPIASESVNIAYSNQLMEHLHPDDAVEQLQSIFNTLVPGGIYLCITPHRFTGPHDISRYFDDEPTGLHLKEYTDKEICKLFKQVGFSKIQSYLRFGKRYMKCSFLPIVIFLECMLEMLPRSIQLKVALTSPFRNIFGIRVIATK